MASSNYTLSSDAKFALQAFIDNSVNRGHVEREYYADNLDQHFQICLNSACNTVQRIAEEIKVRPQRVVEIGTSVGMNAFALQEYYPDAQVVGVEPEFQAVKVATKLAAGSSSSRRPFFMVGIGEQLPLRDSSVDLIICNTVIEHVYNVDHVIGEISRVLRPGGILWLEAPNYVWPREPHLQIWCIPLLGKKLMASMAKLQGKGKQVDFLEHLQLVTPRRLERLFRLNGLVYCNRVADKLRRIAEGRGDLVKAHFRFAIVLRLLGRLGLANLMAESAIRASIYPSLIYSASKYAFVDGNQDRKMQNTEKKL